MICLTCGKFVETPNDPIQCDDCNLKSEITGMPNVPGPPIQVTREQAEVWAKDKSRGNRLFDACDEVIWSEGALAMYDYLVGKQSQPKQ